MAVFEVRWNPSPRELRWFALLGAMFLGGLAATVVRRSAGEAAMAALMAVAVGLAVLGWIAPRTVRPLYVIWMAAAFPAGWLVSHLALAAVYYGVVAPLGLMLRCTGRDPLGRTFDRAAATYWVRREPPTDGRRPFRQF